MRSISIAIFFLLMGTWAAAQRPFSRDYWLNESSSPVKVNALAKDKHGYIWLGTDAGLYRFNGRDFVHIPDSTGGQLTALAVRGDTIYCGFAGGRLARFVAGKLESLAFRTPGPSSQINALAWYAGCLWVCTDAEGVMAFIHGSFYRFDTRNSLSDNYTYGISFTGDGRALVATDRGLNILSMSASGKLSNQVLDSRSGIRDNIVRSVTTDPWNTRSVWGGLQDGGLLHLSLSDSAQVSPALPEWRWGQINDVLPVAGGQVWVATENGYLVECRYSPAGYELHPHFYPGKRFRRLIQDISGSIWCATGEGLTMITDNYISYLPLGPDYSLPDITAMACDRKGNLYYTQSDILYKCSLLGPSSAIPVLHATAPITCLFIDSAERIWAGTLGAGLWCGDGKTFRELHDVPKLLAGQILDISGIGNSLWVSSLNGVEEIVLAPGPGTTPIRIVHHGKRSGTGSDYVYQLFPDSKGRMWMATDGAGICMYDGSRYHYWDSSSGFKSKVVYSITEDAAGLIWAATLNDGLYAYNGSIWRHIDRRQGLQDLAISSIAANASGQLVVVHSKGIDEWYSGSEQFRHYNRRLGMDIDSQSHALNCLTTDTAGNVWVPFEHGLICFQNLPGKYDLRPGISINQVLLFLNQVPVTTYQFGPAENHIGFRFDGINFTNPERLYYRYKLEGYNNTWVHTIDESATFPQLPARSYRFRVQASLSPDFSAAREASYSFSIAAPIWKRKWAIALAFIMLIAAAYGYLRLREHNLRRTAMLQRERMMAEYEQLKSQVNPHFLFNSLNTLASLIEEDSKAAVDYTIHLSDLYRSMLAFKDRDLIYLSEEWSLLQKYVYIQQSRFGGYLLLHADIPDDLAATRQIVPLALQLLVENAIKHNVVSSLHPLHIYITTTADSITVRNAVRPKLSKAAGAGLGLANISRRYALMSSRAVEYGIHEGEFIVNLPLL